MGVGEEALEELKEPGILPRFVMVLPTHAFHSDCEWRWLKYQSTNKKRGDADSKIPWLAAFAVSIEELILLTDDMTNVYVFYDFHGILPLAHLHPYHKSTQAILRKFKREARLLVLGKNK